MLKAFKCSSVLRSAILPLVLPKKYTTHAFKPFYENFIEFRDNTAVVDRLGYFKYRDILYTSLLIANRIETLIPTESQIGKRIAFLCPNDALYVSILLACWITGHVAVPLSSYHPKLLIEFMIMNSESSLVIASDHVADLVEGIAAKVNTKIFTVSSVLRDSSNNFDEFRTSKYFTWSSALQDRNALIIYTSGTTGVPKGVALTHGNLFAQVSSLVKAWDITSQDTILHTLPLYHMHGIMNALLCLLNVGGTVVMRPGFHAPEVWNYLINQTHINPKVNLYYGVPTMYVKLIEAFNDLSDGKTLIKKRCEENIRLMTSGSAALLEPILRRWEAITGHVLLERYGMSEIGMALSNPLYGSRIPGSVGNPLPGVEVKIVEDSSLNESETYLEGNDSHVKVFPGCDGKEGELLVRGPTVFKGYWNNEKATLQAFTDDGWFKTGDTAKYESGHFKILGRISADIIKCGGYKISALAVEACLLSHPEIVDCAVLGVPDEKWGERVSCLLVTKGKKEFSASELKAWCEKSLPVYSIPSLIKHVYSIPRNPMGKMNKRELRKLFS